MVRTLPYGQETGLNPTRIAGISVAILIHAAAFLLLLIPATLPPLARHLPDPKPEITLIPKEKPVVVPVEKSAPTKPQTLTRQPKQPTITAPPLPTTPVALDPPAAIAPMERAVLSDPAPSTADASIAAPTGPIAASHLSYVRAPAPTYPRAALMDRAEGTVILRVLVDVDGNPLEVIVETSSGNRDLDRAARAQVLRNWTFQPAMLNGRAVQAYGRVPVDFSLR